MCAGCNGSQWGGPQAVSKKTGAMPINGKDDGPSSTTAKNGEKGSLDVGSVSYQHNAHTAAPVTNNNGNV